MDPSILDHSLYTLYLMKVPVTIYIDEVLDFHSNSRGGRGIMALVSRGREQGITFLCTTQRPSLISPFLYTEAPHTYIFRLRFKGDRKKIEEITGFNVPQPKKHHFYYVDLENEPVYYEPVPMSVPLARRNALMAPLKKT